MNEVYPQFFGQQKPARTTVEAKFVAPKMRVEIDGTAYRPGSAIAPVLVIGGSVESAAHTL